MIANQTRQPRKLETGQAKLADQTLAVGLPAGKAFLPNERVFYGWK